MVARRRRKRSPPPPRHRALELLASSRDGCTEAIMIAHGFTVPQMVELVRTGLATAHTRRAIAGRRTIEIAYMKIYRGRPAGARGSEVMKTRTHFTHRIDMLDAAGEAITRWPLATIILRQGARVVQDSRRPRVVK